MSLREFFTDWSKGDRMTGFWCLYRLRNRAKRKMIRDILTFFFNRSARRHGPVCRTGWLVEMECTAVTAKGDERFAAL